MLRRARLKTLDIVWVRADGAALPFAAGSFDFVYCHSSPSTTSQTRRACCARSIVFFTQAVALGCAIWARKNLLAGSITAISPSRGASICAIFWPPDTIIETMKAAGFVSVASAYDHLRFEQNLAAWFDIIRRRDTCSRLLAISNASYQAGLKRLARDIADASKPRSREDHLCLITVCGESPGGGIPRPGGQTVC